MAVLLLNNYRGNNQRCYNHNHNPRGPSPSMQTVASIQMPRLLAIVGYLEQHNLDKPNTSWLPD